MEHVRLRGLAEDFRAAVINAGLDPGRQIKTVIDEPGRCRSGLTRFRHRLTGDIRQAREHGMRPTIAATGKSRFRIEWFFVQRRRPLGSYL